MSGVLELLAFFDQVDQICQMYEETRQQVSEFFNVAFDEFSNHVIRYC